MTNGIILAAYKKRPRNGLKIFIAIVVSVVVVVWSSGIINYNGITDSGLAIASSILRAMVNPSWDNLFSLEVDGVPSLMLETVGIAFLGTILGAVLSLPLAFLSSRNIVGDRASFIGNSVISVIRTFPFFILGLMFVRVAGPGPLTGVLTIGALSVGMISKLYIEAVEDIDKGVLDAMDASGATTYQKIRYGVLPQLSANFVSVIMHRFEINVKNATVLGLVGAGGIGFTLISEMSAFRWNDAAASLWGIIIVVLIIEFASNIVRKKIVSG
jgi:phosphonate transport system permease protein